LPVVTKGFGQQQFTLSAKEIESIVKEMHNAGTALIGRPMVSECTMACEAALRTIKEKKEKASDLYADMQDRVVREDRALQKLRAQSVIEATADEGSSSGGGSWAERVSVPSVPVAPPRQNDDSKWIVQFLKEIEMKSLKEDVQGGGGGGGEGEGGPQPQSTSRFASEFQELEVLGRGASGVVVKVRHRLDLGEYAVKQVRLRCGKQMKIMREVHLISSLSHKSIVRYQSAWVEEEYAGAEKSTHQPSNESSAVEETSSTLGRPLFHTWGDKYLGNSDDEYEESDVLWDRLGLEELESSSYATSSSRPTQNPSVLEDDRVVRTLYIQMVS